jgi:DNA modification methylase
MSTQAKRPLSRTMGDRRRTTRPKSAQNSHPQQFPNRGGDLQRGLALLKLISECQPDNGIKTNGHRADGGHKNFVIPAEAEWSFIEKHQANPRLQHIVEKALSALKNKNPSLESLLLPQNGLSDINKCLQREVHLLSSFGANGSEVPMKKAITSKRQKRKKNVIAYRTRLGVCFHGSSEKVLENISSNKIKGKVDLIFTSPPFPLNNKKKYGNLQGQKYIDWLASFPPLFKKMLKRNGSIVIELGNAWEPGKPVMSALAMKALLAFLEKGGFHLCQQFIWNNPARLPSPAQWVTIERIRVKDSFTHIWWMSPSPRPKANNRRVLKEYSGAMKKLLKSRKYNAGIRPSEHAIGEKSFLSNNGGAIPSNVITLSNTSATGEYLEHCRSKDLTPHPARMPSGIPDFFIKFLTNRGDLVLDPFAGSNTTGATAEKLGRRWVAIEAEKEYIRGSRGRFHRKILRRKK